MITEAFINLCFSVILCKLQKDTKIKRHNNLYRDVLDIITFFEKKSQCEIPVSAKSKLDCLKRTCNLKLEGKSNEAVIDSITSFGKKYESLKDFLNSAFDEELDDAKVLKNINQIRIHKKAISMYSNYDQLEKIVEIIKDGSFEAIDDLVDNYEQEIKNLYVNVVDHSRNEAIEASASLDFTKDDHSPILNEIVDKYSRKNKLSAGFQVFDRDVLNGGFETERLYIIGGGSGAGKSTLMNNMIINSAVKTDIFDPDSSKNKKSKVYVYITLENSLSDAYLRTYQPLFSKTTPQVVDDIKKGIDIKQRVIEGLSKVNSTIVMKFFPAYSITPTDLMPVINDIYAEYGDGSIKGLFIDYLDLLRPEVRHEFYRIELGHIALSLKGISSFYKIPVITASQLGRQVYDGISSSKELHLGMMSESIKKVEHADFVALLAKNVEKEDLIHMFIGKNRSGRSNIAIDFTVDFSMYKFVNGSVVSVKKEEGAVKKVGLDHECLKFGGFQDLQI